jgi:hypothetical protein
MRQQAMEADVDAERAERVHADRHEQDAGPTEQPRHEGEQRQQVESGDAAGIAPVDAPDVIRLTS